MAKMVLGTYTFDRNPDTCTAPEYERYTSLVKTYGGAVFFSWGMFIEGVVIEMKWNYMSEVNYASLVDLYDDDEEKVWDPKNGNTYNVQIQSLKGDYFETSLLLAPWRKDVVMRMVITSEVV